MEVVSEKIYQVLATLTPRERRVLKLRFGFDDGQPRTLKEVGKEFCVTGERIRQIEARALRRLRHPSRSLGLKPDTDMLPDRSPESLLLAAIFWLDVPPRYVCAECGKIFDWPRKSGLCQKCLAVKNRVEVTCDTCGKKFWRPKYKIRPGFKHIWCSQHCHGVWFGEHHGVGAQMLCPVCGQRRRRIITYICDNCEEGSGVAE